MESPDDPAIRNSQVLLRAPHAVMATSGLGVSAQGEYAEDLELLRGREESRRGDACIKVVRRYSPYAHGHLMTTMLTGRVRIRQDLVTI